MELVLYEYLPGGRRHKRYKSLLAEFRRGLAEAIGTFAIVLISCLGNASPHTSDLGSALAEGLTIMALVFAIGQVSGAHFNPSTSLAFSLRRVFEWWRLLYYLPAQFIGAMVAGLLVMGFLGKEGDVGATLPDGVSIEAGLAMEVVFSALMNFVYLNVAERAKVVGANGAIAVGVIVTALGIVGGPLGGASMDPFRSLAPALLAGGKPLREVWIFIVGPMVGAVLAALLTFMLGSRVHPYAMLDANGIGRAGPEDEEEQRIDQASER